VSANGPPREERALPRRGEGSPEARPGTDAPAHAWGVTAIAAAAVVAVSALLAANGIVPGESAVRAAVLDVSTSELRSLARTIRPLGTWWGIVPGVLLLLAASRHARHRWWLWGLTLIAAPLAGEALQEFVGRLRPKGPAFGFPSGHATAMAAFAVATIYLVGKSGLRRLLRMVIGFVLVMLTLVMGMSRIVLDAHWPLDVIAGFALGAAGAAAAAWWDASCPWRPREEPPQAHAP
jgi:membrane-associated phospholipid phosphatase